MTLTEIRQLIEKIERFQTADRVSLGLITRLEKVTTDYIQSKIASKLRKRSVNLVGFSVVHQQVYSSIYCAKYIDRFYGNFKNVFLFGGSSTMLPSVRKAFRTFEVPGFFLMGEGEKRLRTVIEKILQTGKEDFSRLEERIASINGVVPILSEETSCSEKSLVLGQLEDLNQLPLPDLDEYFRSARQVCADRDTFRFLMQSIQIPVESTRGCFMKCDFCGFNYSWCGFRQKSVSLIVDQVKALTRKYPARTVRFVDSTCDTWAEKYAEVLIDSHSLIPSYLELRANHPETFWTKLALSGAESIQIGIESFSTPLLKRMKKGTTAVQNVLGLKYLKELGIRSTGNLILWHPRSTTVDVIETKRVTENIPHFGKVNLAIFGLTHGSPLVDQLADVDRKILTLEGLGAVPQELEAYLVGIYYNLPKGLRLERKMVSAWSKFTRWYEKLYLSQSDFQGTLLVNHDDSNLLSFSDTRMGRNRLFSLKGKEVKVYTLCHRGGTLKALALELDMTLERAKELVESWIKSQILVKVDHYYIATALRHRDELINNYLREKEGAMLT